jgi:hypothetical protein
MTENYVDDITQCAYVSLGDAKHGLHWEGGMQVVLRDRIPLDQLVELRLVENSPTGGRSSWATGSIPILASSAMKIGVPWMKTVDDALPAITYKGNSAAIGVLAHASEEVGPERAVRVWRLRFVEDKHRLLTFHPMPFAFEVAVPPIHHTLVHPRMLTR